MSLSKPAKHFFAHFPVLSTVNLDLREILASDASSIIDISFYDGLQATTESEALTMLERIRQDYLQGESVHWGICLKKQKTIIGSCTFYGGYLDNIAEVGYVLKQEHRRKGIMGEALSAIVHFGLYEMGLEAIIAHVDQHNIASSKLLIQTGFSQISSDNNTLKFRITSLQL